MKKKLQQNTKRQIEYFSIIYSRKEQKKKEKKKIKFEFNND